MDFTTFDLACISGSNGAGKSSLLDAMTWVLFGQARKRDESVINNHPEVKIASVAFTFAYEGNIYRVIRALPRGKTTSLEFQIGEPGTASRDTVTALEVRLPDIAGWRPLTEHTLRETQARIEHVLRLDYETFVNAAFFLQGRADQFTQQPSSKRKEILSNILGLEAWEVYKGRAAERRKGIETDLENLRGRIEEINAELNEEPVRRQRLGELGNQLGQLTTARKSQEAALETVRRMAASLAEQRKLVEVLSKTLQRSQENLASLQARLEAKETERLTHADLLARSAEIEASYAGWQSLRADLERWEQTAARFREHETRRQPLLNEINSEQARLEQEKTSLEAQGEIIRRQSTDAGALQIQLDGSRKALEEAERRVTQRAEIDAQVQASREKGAELRSENENLKADMDELKGRIDRLEATDGAICPLCEQALTSEHRESTLARLQLEGRQMGDQWRANKSALQETADLVKNLEARLIHLASAESDRLAEAAVISQLTERLEGLQRASSEWETGGAKRLVKVKKLLNEETFSPEARKKLARVDKELVALGYDASAHDAARRSEAGARSVEADFRGLEAARAALKPLDDEIANLQTEMVKRQAEIARQQSEHEHAAAALGTAESQVPDMEAAEADLFSLQERENQLNQEVGAARQKVMVLDDLR